MRKPQGFRILEEAEVGVGRLVDDPQNANLHPAENLDAIEASLKRFGQPERLIVRKSDRVVFSGNGRLLVLRRLGWKKARVQYVEGPDPECRAYAVSANQTTRMSKWDQEALLVNLKEIQGADSTGLIDATGFTLEDITDMQAHVEDVHKEKAGLPRGKGGSTATCPQCGQTFQLGEKA
ncbi:MAG: hypothetical protein ABR562_05545 [Thermoplasmatota archaeon]|nr:hypothetical protein [Halobacteriales archaeon]